ncbi:SDR family NAD(P)-dependent oxidoreductase [Litoreibacter albidus]|uniref:Short-chain dehydrogenase n=1 Tax=Litoreibacter albidus TaxID=670155 RepID=A0A1H2V172_9RHOB|nr:SDR family NAD(P)-dependent oxidoreductase [Litoreibacter albidus]SDW61709.1 Short-chain dehydrogenase [Litoreibacter albidus]
MARALVIGSSGGIGNALLGEVKSRGYEVVGVSRTVDDLDITSEGSIQRVLGQLTGPFELVVVATGALVVDGNKPEKTIKALSSDALIGQFATNAVGPALLLKHCLTLLPRDAPSKFAVLSARVGSIGDNHIGGWHSYRASKAALNQIIHGAAIELARSHPQCTCACLHPGTVETAFTADYAKTHKTVPPAQAARNLIDVVEGLELAQSGGFFDYAGEAVPW